MTARLMPVKPKKLKINKAFIPLPKDEGDEFFPNGIFEFNITKMLAFIKENPALFPIEEIDLEKEATWESQCLTEATVSKADVSSPIVLAEISPERFNVIDGNHRLARARRMGLKRIPAYRVRVKHHQRFLTSERAYHAYVEYWNAKVKEWGK